MRDWKKKVAFCRNCHSFITAHKDQLENIVDVECNYFWDYCGKCLGEYTEKLIKDGCDIDHIVRSRRCKDEIMGPVAYINIESPIQIRAYVENLVDLLKRMVEWVAVYDDGSLDVMSRDIEEAKEEIKPWYNKEK
jgi:hypothetical protein